MKDHRKKSCLKVRKLKHLSIGVGQIIQVMIDSMDKDSGYQASAPKAAFIAERLGKKRSTILGYLRVIKEFGIFDCHRFTLKEADAFSQEHYGRRLKCLKNLQGPWVVLYTVNSHPLWNDDDVVPDDIDRAMGELVKRSRKKKKVEPVVQRHVDVKPV
jgi:hypothetical protein